MKYFDLHCDTATETFFGSTSLSKNNGHVSLDRLTEVEKYTQVMAIFSRENGSDEECFDEFKRIIEYHKKENGIKQIKSGSELVENDFSYIWSVEDARILCSDISRIDFLYDCGVRIITPVWAGETIIGGAFDTEKGLTDFGKKAVSKFLELDIIPDISHSSEQTAKEIFDLAERADVPVIASHSCSYSVRNHPRNLRDYQFQMVKKSDGIVGLSFCAYHLSDKAKGLCDTDDIMRHINHYLSLGGEDILCIGADFDGAGMPKGIEGIQSIPELYRRVEREHGTDLANKIFYINAYNFFRKYLK